jgi:hypothetical protein
MEVRHIQGARVARGTTWEGRGLGERGTRGSGRGMACVGVGALIGQRRIASDGTEAAVREEGWRMSRVSFLREMGTSRTQVKLRPDGSHGPALFVSLC